MKKHAPFIIIMSLFVIASAFITALTIRNEPQYIRVAAEARTAAEPSHSGEIPRLNLNTATLEELQMLPGIGETRGRDIIAYRDEHGAFLYLDELMQIRGIGESIFANIAPYLKLD
ncbi:MAG: helix-hairpin-helix domain-containing protein [Oscillospiraceae bacterium]|nr:helix-hairpin-helix domain-containing protein [Oscillospiraceae bacterium]